MKRRRFCPVCRNPEVYLYAGGTAGILYECKKCGYVGPLVVEETPKTRAKQKLP